MSSLVEFKANSIRLPDELKSWDCFQLGKGGFASVFEVRIRADENDRNDLETTDLPAALKKFKWEKNISKSGKFKQLENLKQEAKVINNLSHSNIIKLIGVCYDELLFGLLLELCEGGSLGNVCRSIQKETTLELRVLADWAHQISSGMKYLTDRKLIHRDLKADNVLVLQQVCYCTESEKTSSNCCPICKHRPLNKLDLKITDFGFSKSVTSVGDSIVGTLVWLAPEVFRMDNRQSLWSEFSDVWSFGVLLWELLAREIPHAGEYPIVIANQNLDGQTLELKESWPIKWREIMGQCWSLEPKERPTFSSLVEYFENYTKGLVEVHISDLPSSEKTEEKKIMCFSRKHKVPDDTPLIMKRRKSRTLKKKTRKKLLILILSLLGVITTITTIFFFLFGIIQFGFASPCPVNYTYFSGFCYKVKLASLPFKKALLICESDGGSLASIHSSQESDFIKKLYDDTLLKNRATKSIMEEQTDMWIGRTFDKFNDGYIWTDGSDSDFKFFKEDTNKKPGYSGYLLQGISFTVKQEDELGSYACKINPKETEKTCSNNFEYVGSTGFCYKVHLEPVSFERATETCAEANSHVLSISSEVEHIIAVRLYKNKLWDIHDRYSRVKRTYLWTSLTYQNGNWSWSDTTKYDYQNWEFEYPKLHPEQFWTIIKVRDHFPIKAIDEKWISVGTPNYFAFICKKPDDSVENLSLVSFNLSADNVTVSPSPEPEVAYNENQICSAAYSYFEKTGYCYKANGVTFEENGVTFEEAEKVCISEGAQLVSIHSYEENLFVRNLVTKNQLPGEMRYKTIFIGLIYRNNRWEWTDGTNVDYSNWVVTEPNYFFGSDSAKSELCVTILLEPWSNSNFGCDEWNNFLCYKESSFVCKNLPLMI